MQVKKIVKNIFDKMIDILCYDSEYGLSDKQIFYLKSLKNIDIYTVNELKNSIVLKNFWGEDTAIYQIEKYCPQVIDPLPVLIGTDFIELCPIIVVPDFCNSFDEKWIVVHEICHLFSLGRYNFHSNLLWHCFGINYYIYDKNIKLIRQNINDEINEILNDAVTWHFMKLLENERIQPKNYFIEMYCKMIVERNDIKQIIGFYFSNRIEDLTKKLEIVY